METTLNPAAGLGTGSLSTGFRLPAITGEARLIDRARRGDADAFERLYRSYVGRVHAVCRRFVKDETRAEDLTQEVFLRLWQRLDSFRGQSAFFSWIYRMTVNLCIDHVRAESRRSGVEIGDGPLDALPDRRPRNRGDDTIDLESAIGELPPGARLVFILHDVEGYRHEDIAEMAGLAPGTCRAQLHRARRLMREMLKS